MKVSIVDLIFLLATGGLLALVNYLGDKLPETILIKGQNNQIVFSLAKIKVKWLIVGLGFYVWLMEFIILNQLLLLRLLTPLLLELSIFSLFVLTHLGYKRLGERAALFNFFLFIISVIYLVI